MAIEKKINTTLSENEYTGTTKATHPGKLGDHPVGGAVGAAVGGAAGAIAAGAASGAMAGAAAGPLGVVAGAGVGGVVGALAGKGIAQMVNPTTEDAYWEENYSSRPYADRGVSYDTYRPAYRHGIDSFTKYEGRSFNDVESDIARDWETTSADRDTLSWDKAKPATRDAYERLCTNCTTSKKI